MGEIKKSDMVNSKTVSLLHKLSQTKYQGLKDTTDSNYEYLFNIGDDLGANIEEGGDVDVNREEIFIKAKTAKETLETVSDQAHEFFKKIKKKIDTYKKLELISQIIAAIGSSAILITLLNEFEENKDMKFKLQLISGVIATIGSILSIFLNRGLGAWSFNRRNRVEDYDNLVESKLRSERLLRDLVPKIQIFDALEDLEEVSKIINETEDLSEKVGVLIADYS
ncbi:hypothetical protein [Tenacibaculum sp. MAR_2009_124]|uniref:hypothetical protein n=1 Tax=Tenacibaculum sp. MAR_2009_124 TaxID=1250059 RepID=UPI00115FF2F4|nr:hypothetical protein [Tenacibaculum sp. MAR_2009_124]